MDGSYIINNILEYSGLNPKSFSEKIGLDRPQAIYDIQKGKTKNISPNMADKIVSAFPEINRTWLLTGEGEMLNPTPGITQHQNGGSNNSQTVTMGQADVGRFLDEIAAQRRMTEKAQEQIDRLLTLLEGR